MKSRLITCMLFFCSMTLQAQNNSTCSFHGVVVIGSEEALLQGAYLKCLGTGDDVITDDEGNFSLRVSCSGPDTLILQSISGSEKFLLQDGKYTDDTLRIVFKLYNLNDIFVTPKEPVDIVRKAVARIPINYPETSHVAFGFYRNYKLINNRFRELTELQMAVAMRFEEKGQHNELREAYAVDKIRRTLYTISIDEFYKGQLTDLFTQNLVYHTDFAFFNNIFIKQCDFSFDSTSTDSTWVINYKLTNITGENHGVSNYSPVDFYGEATETGYLVINKSDYAIIKLVRESLRNKKYEYPKRNNFLLPDLQYSEQFHEGFLECDYAMLDGKYYPVSIFHAYKNTFTHNPTNSIAYIITDYSEWHCDSISEMIDPVWMQRFDKFTALERMYYTYDPNDWTQTPSWYFIRNEQVYGDLQLMDDPEILFKKSGE